MFASADHRITGCWSAWTNRLGSWHGSLSLPGGLDTPATTEIRERIGNSASIFAACQETANLGSPITLGATIDLWLNLRSWSPTAVVNTLESYFDCMDSQRYTDIPILPR